MNKGESAKGVVISSAPPLWRPLREAVVWPPPSHVAVFRLKAMRSSGTWLRTSSLRASLRASALVFEQDVFGASGSGSRVLHGAEPGVEGQAVEAGRLRCGAILHRTSSVSQAYPPATRSASSSVTNNWIGHWASLSLRS